MKLVRTEGSPGMKKVFVAAARKNVCLPALFITALLTLLMWKIDMSLSGTGGRGAMYLHLAFTETNFKDILSSWRSGGVDVMLNAAWLYFLYPASCAVLFSSAIAFFTRLRRGDDDPASTADLVFFSLPLAGCAAGWAAQVLLLLIFRSGAVSAPLILAESVAASVSWALFVLSLVLILRSYFLFRKSQKGSSPRNRGV